MDDDGGFGFPNWGYYDRPSKGNLVLRLMSSAVERNAKPLLSDGVFGRSHSSFLEQSVPTDFVRDRWIHHGNGNIKNFLTLLVNHQRHLSCGILADPSTVHNDQMTTVHNNQIIQHSDPHTKVDKVLMVEETTGKNKSPLKNRPSGRPQKSPMPRKAKKVTAPSDEVPGVSVSLGKARRKSIGMVINGVNFDISKIPIPVCSCTGKPQPCYRWGIGGWQSACCTTNISIHPLPMSTKRRGARIAGRKMSQGAFKKVLKKLAGEGYNLSNPIDLRTFWAKHGTNKFVTIR